MVHRAFAAARDADDAVAKSIAAIIGPTGLTPARFSEADRMAGEVVAAAMTSHRFFLGPSVLCKRFKYGKCCIEVFIEHPHDHLCAADVNRSGRCIRRCIRFDARRVKPVEQFSRKGWVVEVCKPFHV